MKAYCNQERIQELLDGRPLSYIVQKMNEEVGIEIEYRNYHSLYSNKSNWLLKYALATAKILKCPVEEIFYLK